jgi:hypothetical protein
MNKEKGSFTERLIFITGVRKGLGRVLRVELSVT